MKLVLYHFPSCPFCQKVFRYLDSRSDLEIEKKDIYSDPAIQKELASINSGITQVPCLVIDGKPMLESDDIIKYLKGIE